MLNKMKQEMTREEIVKALRIIISQELRNQNYYLLTSRILEKACLLRLREHQKFLLIKIADKKVAFSCYVEALDSLLNDGHIHVHQTQKRISVSHRP